MNEQLPITKLINFLREHEPYTYGRLTSGEYNYQTCLDVLSACLSTGKTLDSPVCLGDEYGDPKFFRGSDRDHWLYWQGFWHNFCDEPHWSMLKTHKVLVPPTVRILMEMGE